MLAAVAVSALPEAQASELRCIEVSSSTGKYCTALRAPISNAGLTEARISTGERLLQLPTDFDSRPRGEVFTASLLISSAVRLNGAVPNLELYGAKCILW